MEKRAEHKDSCAGLTSTPRSDFLIKSGRGRKIFAARFARVVNKNPPFEIPAYAPVGSHVACAIIEAPPILVCMRWVHSELH